MNVIELLQSKIANADNIYFNTRVGGLILLGPDNHCREYDEKFEPDQNFMDVLLERAARPAA